ncbi:polysaccharide biosynthesis C-terminal domain-containing protein [Aliivibrio fischeri]
MFGFMMGGLYKIPTLIINFHKKIWIYPIASVLSSVLNLLLNLSLIPVYGIVGAAFASFASLFMYSGILQYYSSRYYGNKKGVFVRVSYATVFIIIISKFIIDANVYNYG